MAKVHVADLASLQSRDPYARFQKFMVTFVGYVSHETNIYEVFGFLAVVTTLA
jgi:hypothetical protein